MDPLTNVGTKRFTSETSLWASERSASGCRILHVWTDGLHHLYSHDGILAFAPRMKTCTGTLKRIYLRVIGKYIDPITPVRNGLSSALNGTQV